MACGPSARRRAPPRTSSSTSRGCARHWPPTTAGRASSPTDAATSSRCPQDAVDAVRFEQLVEEARREAGQAPGRTAPASAALELWRGAPLADVASEPFAPARDPPARGASSAGARAGDRRRARRRAPRRGDRPTRGADRRGAAARAPSRPAHARPLSRRAPVRGARCLPRGAPDAGRTDRGRARARAAPPPGADPRPGPGPRRAAADRRAAAPARGRLAAARRARARAGLAAPALGSRRARAGSVCALVWGPAGIGKTRLVAELAAEVQGAGRGGALRRRRRGRRGRPGDRRRGRQGPPTDAAGARLRRRRAAGGARGRRGARPRARGPGAHDLRPAPRRAGPARVRRPARERRRPAPAARSAGRGRGGRDRGALRARRGRRDAAADAARRERRGAASDPPRGRRVGAGGGGRAARRDRRSGGRRSQRVCARPRPRSRAASSTCRPPRERTRLYAVEEPPDPSAPEVCPFRGLAPFDAAHAEYFFGRERLVAELVARLVGSTLLAVVGPSGSGKSSAVRAGLLPALADGVVPGSERWRRARDAPRRAPARRALPHPRPRGARGRERGRRAVDRRRARPARARRAPGALRRPVRGGLRRLPRRGRARRRSSTRWSRARPTPTSGWSSCSRSAPTSTGAAPSTPSSRRWSAPTRSWSGRCAATSCAGRSSCPRARRACGSSRGWSRRWSATSPASPAACRCSPPPCSSSGSDATAAPLRYRAYERTGGVEGAVARLAEDAYQRLSEAERRRARPLLLRLAGDEEEAPRRSSAAASPLDELELERDPDAARALAVLTESRLVTVDEGTVEVAHEALLREWPRLRGWLASRRRGPAPSPAPDRRLPRVARLRARSRRALPRRPARCGARLGRRARPRAERARARVPRREPGGERARGRAPAPRQPPPADAARRRRRAARRRRGRRGDRALRAPGRAQRGHRRRRPATRRPRRSPRTASTRRFASPARASPWTTRSRPAPACSRSSLRSPAALGVLNGDGGKLYSLALSPDGGTLATGDRRHRDPLRHPDAGANRRIPGGGSHHLAWLPSPGRLARDHHEGRQRERAYLHDHRRRDATTAQLGPARPPPRRPWVALHPLREPTPRTGGA